jgi:hypothetical protein
MKCEWVRENIVLSVYGELADDARHELEQHVARCADCAAELKAEQEFHALLVQGRAADSLLGDPSPNLLAASRMRLQEGLETVKQGSFFSRLAFDPANWLLQMKFSPALASVILVLGFAGGIGTAYKVLPRATSDARIIDRPQPTPEAPVASISSIVQDPNTNQVSIKYNTVSTQEAQGPLNDQKIQQLLLFAARNNYNSGVRVDSVDLLAQRSSDLQVREALMYALQNDTNPGVRLKSLDALGNYVKNDTNVRDAVLRALVNDGNSGVRIEALRLIEPVKADGSVRGVLMALAAKDSSQYIKSQARTMLAQLPEID